MKTQYICPTIQELPQPPNGKSGWPWTDESQAIADFSGAQDWPKISIVTPSYNKGKYIEETIRSVLLQGYPELEYVIVDGASCDRSPALIDNYAPWLAWTVSEADGGQYQAINKGFERTNGTMAIKKKNLG